MDLSHRTLFAVVPSTDPQASSLWEDKPPRPFGRGIVAEIRKVSLAVVFLFLWLPLCFIGHVQTVFLLSRLYLRSVDNDRLRLYLSGSFLLA